MTTEAGKRLLAECWREDGDGVTERAIAAIEAEAIAAERERITREIGELRPTYAFRADAGGRVIVDVDRAAVLAIVNPEEAEK